MGVSLGWLFWPFLKTEGGEEDQPPAQSPGDATTPATNASTNNDIASKPLGQQPKAIIDKATTQIDHAQQVENDKMAQVEATAQ